MSNPTDRKYAASHEWAHLDPSGLISVGITHHAQEALGDIVFLDLPEIGKTVEAGKDVAVVESVKAASDIYAPVSGEVVEINSDAADDPASVNADPFGVWLFKILPSNVSEMDALLDADAYTETAAEDSAEG